VGESWSEAKVGESERLQQKRKAKGLKQKSWGAGRVIQVVEPSKYKALILNLSSTKKRKKIAEPIFSS
jgi:hypothetical protein